MSDAPPHDLLATINRTKAALKRSREASERARKVADQATISKPIEK